MPDPCPLLSPLAPAPNLTSGLVKRLAFEIESGKLPPGSRLPTEQALINATGVSRTVVREAISALRADGLVITRQGVGAFVSPDARNRPFRIHADELQSINEVLKIFELRISIETEAAGFAAERRTKRHLGDMKRCLRLIDHQIELGETAADADYAFHKAVFAAAVAVGGVALTGGIGGAKNAALGALIVTALNDGLIPLNVNPYAQEAVNGIVLVVAVALTIDRKKLGFIK